MSRRILTHEQKQLTGVFRWWLRNPTNPDMLRQLVEDMVNYELKCRLKQSIPKPERQPEAGAGVDE